MLSFESHGIYATGVDKTRAEIINGQAPKRKIIVAVIDSGVEIDHDDLKESIWTNADEIPDNGIDDDKNGYVDDIHGWNFLTDDLGNDINYQCMEATSVLRLARDIKENNGVYPSWLTNDLINEALRIYNDQVDEFKSMEMFNVFYTMVDTMFTRLIGKSDYTFEEVAAVNTSNEQALAFKGAIAELVKSGMTKADLVELAQVVYTSQNYHLNYDYKPRTEPKPGDQFYGNNHYEGSHSEHGTHVAGIIAANSTNNLGGRGVAFGCAEIMSIRAVPDGDESDIDVANAIRYAVDNGANVINMSFGKGLSPYKSIVDDAVKYAADHNVLLIHGAGNESDDNGKVANFPNRNYSFGGSCPSFIEVGANSSSAEKDLTASFSNYGLTSVDIFAPGVDIYSTVPDNGYKFLSGTSMASPVVAGVAAFIWAYNPDISAVELKSILMDSTTKLPKKKVLKPGGKKGKEKIKFDQLSITGGIVNAYAAMQLAQQRKG